MAFRVCVGQRFTRLMQHRLDLHQHDRDPYAADPMEMCRKLLQSAEHLIESIHQNQLSQARIDAADVANYAMLVSGDWDAERVE